MVSLFSKGFSGIVTGIAKPITKFLGGTPITAKQFRESKVGKVLTVGAGVTTAALGVVTLPQTAPFIARGVLKRPILSLAAGGLISTKAGRQLTGKTVEGIFKGGKGIPEAVETFKKGGGLIDVIKGGGLVAAGVLAATELPKVIERFGKKDKVLPAQVLPPIGGRQLEDQTLGAVQPTPKVVPVVAEKPLPSIKNTFKPEINIKINTTGIKRKFINQQNFMRA